VNQIDEQQRRQLEELCRQFGVDRLELFGSANRADFDPAQSDIDFIVRFRNPERPGYAERYLDFAEALERLFGRPVDLLTERSLRNPLFIREIAADRSPVYAA
jgi:predicted nucleotidyltransferase